MNVLKTRPSAKSVYVPVERGGCIGSREDILRHEQTPRNVLPVSPLPEARHLQQKAAIRAFHQSADRREVGVHKVGDAYMLRHFNRRDLVELHFRRDVPVVAEEDVCRHTSLFASLIAEFLALHRERDASCLSPVEFRCVPDKRAPPGNRPEPRYTFSVATSQHACANPITCCATTYEPYITNPIMLQQQEIARPFST